MSIRRDYKPVSSRQRRRQHARRNGLLVMTLVLIGLFGSLLAYIKGDRNQPSAPPVAATPAAPSRPAAPPRVTVPEPAVEPSSAARPKYDFYTELPKRQVEIAPETPPSPRTPPRPAAPRPTPANDPLHKTTGPNHAAAHTTMAVTARPPQAEHRSRE